MSAETLRRAAALMRERAEAATPAPWEFDAEDMYPGVWSDSGSAGTWVVSEWGTREANATHIASWHPAVALAVAFVVTVPVNRWLLARGKGHAVVHQYHH